MRVRILRTTVIALICASGFLGIQCLSAEEQSRRWPGAGPDPVPFEDAQFTFSADPSEVVLSVVASGGRTANETAIFGDGRVELRKIERWGRIGDIKTKVLESHELLLSYDELVSLVRVAVTHGLAEASAEALKEKRKNLGQRGGDSGHSSYRIAVALTSYSRGSIVRDRIENAVHAKHSQFSSGLYPEILEYAGFRALNEATWKLWESVQESSK